NNYTEIWNINSLPGYVFTGSRRRFIASLPQALFRSLPLNVRSDALPLRTALRRLRAAFLLLTSKYGATHFHRRNPERSRYRSLIFLNFEPGERLCPTTARFQRGQGDMCHFSLVSQATKPHTRRQAKTAHC
ncbi:hypothetical protein ANANG_G00094110, partial [Anguilla anguilla]